MLASVHLSMQHADLGKCWSAVRTGAPGARTEKERVHSLILMEHIPGTHRRSCQHHGRSRQTSLFSWHLSHSTHVYPDIDRCVPSPCATFPYPNSNPRGAFLRRGYMYVPNPDRRSSPSSPRSSLTQPSPFVYPTSHPFPPLGCDEPLQVCCTSPPSSR